ncbi:hypothetical protein N0V90_012915 [Kalmusia sp. IMI 367209]|nr:hypothetical protein N0V90_012915 [Kalmusia sp. IMI 367209]
MERKEQRVVPTFLASEVMQCLSSVPFNPAVASRFVKYFNDSIQFHSTLSYLKNPPRGYQQAPIDLVQELGVIQDKIDRTQFRNEYDFEQSIQQLIYAVHDNHFHLNAGILSAFRFYSPWSIVSLSSDGKEAPKLYLRQDANAAHYDEGHVGLKQLSPITLINGQDAEQFLTKFSQKHSPGNIDPHADWNALMYSPAQMISGDNELFRNLVLYPGDDLTITLQNGTIYGPEPFRAIYTEPGPTGPLETGGDFYNFFALGYYPSGFYETVIEPILEAEDQTSDLEYVLENPDNWEPSFSIFPVDHGWLSKGWSQIDPAWPKPNLLEAGFDSSSDAMISGMSVDNLESIVLFLLTILTGYFIDHTDLAVLSIPTFEAEGYSIDGFISAINKFLEECISQGKRRLVIDLQRNGGGSTTLAVETFKHFFPDIEPYVATRMRAHSMANELGTFTDGVFREWEKNPSASGDVFVMSSNEWVTGNRINPNTNETFRDWQEFFFSPNQFSGDNFTNNVSPHLYHGNNPRLTSFKQLYNYSDAYYVTDSMSYPETLKIVYGYPGNPPRNREAFAAKDITILTDGLCNSACAMFVEMMRHDAGVKTVAVGGRPGNGPMQATGGTRGARGYSIFNLDLDMQHARAFAEESNQTITSLPERVNSLFILSAGVNLRDTIRKGQVLPLQFMYDAADCRLYFTEKTLFNHTALWLHAAEAIQSPDNLCVPGSTVKSPPIPIYRSTVDSDEILSGLSPYLNDQLLDAIVQQGDAGVRGSIRNREGVPGLDCSFDSSLSADLEIPDKVRIQNDVRLPGQPTIRLGETACLWQYLDHELCSPDLEKLAPYLWLMSMQSSANISALHRQRVKDRRIIITEDPQLHLVWINGRIFIKPLPPYLLSYVFWAKYLHSEHDTASGNANSSRSKYTTQQQRVIPAALGFLRTYSHLIKHESDFNIAKDERLVPSNVTWAAFIHFISSVASNVHDFDVSERYNYGELRLSRLNFYSKIFLHRFYFHREHREYGPYFAQFFAPLLFAFAMLSVVLSALQVVTATEALLPNKATLDNFWTFCRWISMLIVGVISSISAVMLLLFLYRFVGEWYWAITRRIKKRMVRKKSIGSPV